MKMIARLLALLFLASASAPLCAQSRGDIEQAMKRATHFMVDKVATRGG